jgi:hypothetical protein
MLACATVPKSGTGILKRLLLVFNAAIFFMQAMSGREDNLDGGGAGDANTLPPGVRDDPPVTEGDNPTSPGTPGTS